MGKNEFLIECKHLRLCRDASQNTIITTISETQTFNFIAILPVSEEKINSLKRRTTRQPRNSSHERHLNEVDSPIWEQPKLVCRTVLRRCSLSFSTTTSSIASEEKEP